MTFFQLLKRISFFLCLLFSSYQTYSQCIEIESILVDACGTDEGLNEMVRFHVGNAPLNVNNLIVSWPNNPWGGLIQNEITSSKTAALNADIVSAGGCGELREPVNGIIPANATVILVTSYNMDTALNSFGALTSDIYIIYQNSNVTAGHFANFGSGLRTLSMIVGSSCIEMVTYNRALLITSAGVPGSGDGAIVNFSTNNTPTYINNDCSAPVPPFAVDAGIPVSVCAGSAITLNGVTQGQQNINWSAPSGVFSNSSSLTSTYTPAASAAGTTVIVTLTITNSCQTSITDTVAITITNGIVPNFATALSLCANSTAPTLVTTSPNGISGMWTPAIISNTVSGSYVFTPNPNQCAQPVTLNVSIANSIIPNFATSLILCANSTVPTLATTSPNGIIGSWNPALLNNTVSGSYVFTPNPNQCAQSVTLNVSITNSITPNFATSLILCASSTVPTLEMTSPNGITGSWNPSTINSTADGTYLFTPNQCGEQMTLVVEIVNSIIPDFETSITLCRNSVVPILNTTSPNGISGTWNPITINLTQSGTYIFTPDAGQCATITSLSVNVSSVIFEIAGMCTGSNFIIKSSLESDSDDSLASYQWTNADGRVVGTESELNISALSSGDRGVFPQVFNLTITIGGCCNTKSINVDGIFCNIPRGISPNNDGKNDYFDLSGMRVKELNIFNRYGLNVYNQINYTNQWKGQTSKGNELPDGTYYYVLTTNSASPVTGWVYINRQY